MSNILQKVSLKNRYVTGDKFLDALDTIDLIESIGGLVDSEAYATLFHATDSDSAEKIIQTQKMYGKEDGIFFSTSANGQIKGYGKTIITVFVPMEKLILDDQFRNELHFRIEVKPYSMIDIKAKYLN